MQSNSKQRAISDVLRQEIVDGKFSEDSDHYPVSWEVEASHDGVTWTNVETRTDVVHAHPGTYYFYDGEKHDEANARRGSPVEHFRFSGYKSDGLAADPAKAVSLQVDGANFSSWSVCIDGKPASGRRVELNGNGELVVSGMGMVIIVF